MFFKLASSPMGLLCGGGGFVLMFLVNLIGRRGFFAAFAGGFFGAAGFFAAWCLLAGLCLMLFSPEEMDRIFFSQNKSASEGGSPPVFEYKLDDSADLTAEELYSPETPPQGGASLEPPAVFSEGDPAFAQLAKQASAAAASPLDSMGRFNLQSGTRVVRTNAKEAAQAARKVLMNDKS